MLALRKPDGEFVDNGMAAVISWWNYFEELTDKRAVRSLPLLGFFFPSLFLLAAKFREVLFLVPVFAVRVSSALRAVVEGQVAIVKSPPAFAAGVADAAPVKVALKTVFAGYGSVAKIGPVGSCCRHGVHSVRFVFVGIPTPICYASMYSLSTPNIYQF